MQLLRVIFLLSCFTYVVFSIVSTVSHCWMQTVSGHNGEVVKKGLFMECKESKEECTDLPDKNVPEWYDDVRALAIVSCVFSSLAVFVEIIHQTAEEVHKYFTVFMVFLSDVLLLIALSMFTSKHDFNFGVYEYGWGFMLSWISFVFGIGSTVIGVVSVYDKSIQRKVELVSDPQDVKKTQKV